MSNHRTPQNEEHFEAVVCEKFWILDKQKHPKHPKDILEWAKWTNKDSNRRVARDSVGDATVSTVFLGLDHGWGTQHPVLWETAIFRHGRSVQIVARYTSHALALAGHRLIVSDMKDTQHFGGAV